MSKRLPAKKTEKLNQNSIFELKENVKKNQQFSFIFKVKLFVKKLFQKNNR